MDFDIIQRIHKFNSDKLLKHFLPSKAYKLVLSFPCYTGAVTEMSDGNEIISFCCIRIEISRSRVTDGS